MEYAPEPLAGSVEFRKTDDGATFIVRPTAAGVLQKLLLPTLTSLGSAITFFVAVSGIHPLEFSLRSLAIPLCIGGMGLLVTFESIWPYLYPIKFEVTPVEVVMRWRRPTEWKVLRWQRSEIQDVRAKRVRIKNKMMLRHWSLVFRPTNSIEMAVLVGRPRQLETLAQHLRVALGIGDSEPEAMNLPAPKGCRYRRVRWGNGVIIRIPPRGERAISVLVAVVCGVAALAGSYLAHAYLSDDMIYGAVWKRDAATVGLLLLLAGIAWAGIIACLAKMRRSVHIFASPTNVFVIEAGLIRPMTVEWKTEQLAEISVISTENGRASLKFTPHQGLPLMVAAGEPSAYLEWIVSVARTSQKDRRLSNAPPQNPPEASHPSG